MEREQTCLLGVLKAFLWDEPFDFTGLDMEKLKALADIHSVTGILASVYLKYGTDEACRAAMRKLCMSTVGLYARRAQLMKQLTGKLSDAGIDHMLMKGYVLKDYYPMPELRTYGDIDFAIRAEDREKSDRLMRQWGYHAEVDWGEVYSYTRNPERYELHTSIMAEDVYVSDKADYQGYFQDVWAHARPAEGRTWLPVPEFHLLYLLTHIAKHIGYAGAGARMYLDIAVFLRHFQDRLDREALAAELEKLRFADFANLVFSAVEDWFGVESPIPLRETAPGVLADFTAFTLEGGVFGFAGQDAAAVSLKRENRNEDSVSRTATLLHRLFPPAGMLKNQYTCLQKHPGLLPVVWVRRLFRVGKRFSSHAEEAKRIFTADDEAVLRLQRIYKETGL